MSKATLGAAARVELASKMNEFAEAYRADADLRARSEAEPRAVLAERGLDALAWPPGADVRIVADTGDTMHFMLPPDPNMDLTDDDLVSVSGGFCCQAIDLSCFVRN